MQTLRKNCRISYKRVMRVMSLFFFQAEDGIRDYKVTGVQTCALPICIADVGGKLGQAGNLAHHAVRGFLPVVGHLYRQHAPWRQLGEQAGYQRFMLPRSEERRVGKECRSRWSPYH